MQVFEGHLDGKNLRVAIVASRFNETITAKLLESACRGLLSHAVRQENIVVTWVPGAFEIPLMAKRLAETKKFDALICLGAVIRGETFHFELVARGAAEGILHAMLDTRVPIIFEVLATENVTQALERVEVGFSAATTAISMANLNKTLCV